MVVAPGDEKRQRTATGISQDDNSGLMLALKAIAGTQKGRVVAYAGPLDLPGVRLRYDDIYNPGVAGGSFDGWSNIDRAFDADFNTCATKTVNGGVVETCYIYFAPRHVSQVRVVLQTLTVGKTFDYRLVFYYADNTAYTTSTKVAVTSVVELHDNPYPDKLVSHIYFLAGVNAGVPAELRLYDMSIMLFEHVPKQGRTKRLLRDDMLHIDTTWSFAGNALDGSFTSATNKSIAANGNEDYTVDFVPHNIGSVMAYCQLGPPGGPVPAGSYATVTLTYEDGTTEATTANFATPTLYVNATISKPYLPMRRAVVRIHNNHATEARIGYIYELGITEYEPRPVAPEEGGWGGGGAGDSIRVWEKPDIREVRDKDVDSEIVVMCDGAIAGAVVYGPYNWGNKRGFSLFLNCTQNGTLRVEKSWDGARWHWRVDVAYVAGTFPNDLDYSCAPFVRITFTPAAGATLILAADLNTR